MVNLVGICAYEKDGRRKWKGDAVDWLVTAATKSKPRGQEGIVKMSGCNKL
jgi:phage terminase large subunit-like protein